MKNILYVEIKNLKKTFEVDKMDKKEIIQEIKEYSNSYVEVKFGKEDDFFFKFICGSIHMNNICFRNVSDIHFCGDTMWIGNDITIDVQDVDSFRVHEESWLVE